MKERDLVVEIRTGSVDVVDDVVRRPGGRQREVEESQRSGDGVGVNPRKRKSEVVDEGEEDVAESEERAAKKPRMEQSGDSSLNTSQPAVSMPSGESLLPSFGNTLVDEIKEDEEDEEDDESESDDEDPAAWIRTRKTSMLEIEIKLKRS